MKKNEKFIIFGIILLIIGCIFFSGCSLIKPIVTAVTPTASNVPQEKQKVNNVTKCDGEIKVLPDGSYSCTEKFYKKESGSTEKERKLTFFEKIRQFFYKYFVIYCIVMIALLIFAPSIFYYFIGKQKNAFLQVIRAIEKHKDTGKDIKESLSAETDTEVKKLISDLKFKYNI